MLLEQLLKLTPPDHVEIHELQAATLACLLYTHYDSTILVHAL